MSVDGLRQQLKTFGLSEKEVDMYISVLKHGEAPAKTLSDDADLSVRYVYDVGEQLAERGLVTMNDHAKPTTIRARPPGEAVSELVHELRTVETGLETLYSEPEPQTSRFEILQSRQTILRRMQSYIQDAQDEILLMVPGSIMESLYDVLENAIDRDVLVLVLLTGKDLKGPDVLYNRLGEKVSAARVWSETAPFRLSVDVHSGIVSHTDALQSTPNSGDAVAVTQNQLVSSIAGSFLSNYWPIAEEAYVADPPTFPKTYEYFRHAVFDATVYNHRYNESLYASVEQTNPGDKQPSTIEGEIVKIRQSLVQPPTNSFPIESSFDLATADGRRSVAGEGSFLEDVEAQSVTLKATPHDR